MDNDPDRSSSSRRLKFSTENFDDYVTALMAKLRLDSDADRVISGELVHPLVSFQLRNQAPLQALNVPYVSQQELLRDPVAPYINWLRILTDNLFRAPAPVPDVEGLQELQNAQNVFRRAERYIYSTIVFTL